MKMTDPVLKKYVLKDLITRKYATGKEEPEPVWCIEPSYFNEFEAFALQGKLLGLGYTVDVEIKFMDKSPYPYSECAMEFDVLKRLRARGYMVTNQVSIGGRYADIVFYVSKTKTIISIELKLTKWQDALEQALDHRQYGAHFAYICMPPKKTFPRTMQKALQEKGIGFFEYKPPIEEIKCHKGGIYYTHSTDYSYPFAEKIIPKINLKDGHYFRNRIVGQIERDHYTDLHKARLFVDQNKHVDIDPFPDWMKVDKSKEYHGM